MSYVLKKIILLIIYYNKLFYFVNRKAFTGFEALIRLNDELKIHSKFYYTNNYFVNSC